MEFAKYIGAKYAVAVSNGTAALHLSGLALGIKKGTKVITSPLSFAMTEDFSTLFDGEMMRCKSQKFVSIDIVNDKLNYYL